MGNRAMVCPVGKNYGVYLHWNGGRDSVEAFLKYCELKGYRGFDDSYGMARFTQVVANFFGGSNSIGIEFNVQESDAEWYDNGIYYVEGWEIVGRVYDGAEQHCHKLENMLVDIDNAQPVDEQLGDFLKAEEVPTECICVGDVIYDRDCSGKMYSAVVESICKEDRRCNGTNVKGIPFVRVYDSEFCPAEKNINNYLTEASYRVLKTL